MMFPLQNSSPRHSSGQGNANVKVVVRVRPLNDAEQSDKYQIVTEAISDHMLVFDPKIPNTSGFMLMSQRDITRRRCKDLKYAFDHVFGPSATNRDVFEQTTKSIVNGVLNGYNCSVFAYGATGAGKTHTMLGGEREPGVIYYTMIDLYKRINEQKEEKMFDVAVSYAEVYNEQVRDLLMPRGNLPIREDKNVGVIIAGLSLHKPKTADELLHMLQFGNKNRTQHPTDANAESSRSHAVFQVFVNQRERSASVSTEVRMAKMCLVDLAGSERATNSTNCGARFREGANINRSLLALGNVINALADNKFKGHIPYRDSKLTRLLKDSLGGNCQTVMIAAVSPSSKSFEDTYNTLRYADRAKHIRADLKKNVLSVDFHIANYKKYVKELEKENQELKQAKQKLTDTLEDLNAVMAPAMSPILRQFQERLKDMFKQRKQIRKAQMESEGAKRELKWKVTRKEHSIKRVQHMTGSPTIINKHKRIIERMNRRIIKEEQALKDSARTIQEHDNAIISTCSEIRSTLNSRKETQELMELNVRIHNTEATLYDTHMYLAFVKKMARAQERQSFVNERLMSCLIQLVKKQHDILHSQDLLNNELKTKYEQCCYLVEERGVAWTSPVVEQERSACQYNLEETDDFCISDIIDIQIPKLHLQAVLKETMPGTPRRVEAGQHQLAQRVPTMSAVKPMTRLMSGQYHGSGDRARKNVSSPNYFNGESVDYSNSQLCTTHEEKSSLLGLEAGDTITTDVRQKAQDTCVSAEDEPSSKKCSSSSSTSGMICVSAEEKVEKRDGEFSGDLLKDNARLIPSSSLQCVQRELRSGLRPISWQNQVNTVQFQPINQPEEKVPPGNNLNDTFLLHRPSLHHGSCDGKVAQPHSLVTRNSISGKTTGRLPLDRIAMFQTLDTVTDGNCETSTTNSPLSRHPPSRLPPCNNVLSAWGSNVKVGNKELPVIKRPSIDSLPKLGPLKVKMNTFIQGRGASHSPVGRQPSPSTVFKSAVTNYSSSNSPTIMPGLESRKAEAVCCVNANNVNSPPSFFMGPRSDSVFIKSPTIIPPASHCPTASKRPMAMVKHWNSEPPEKVMKTPDFSSVQCSQLVSSVLNRVSQADALTVSDVSKVRDVRKPLQTLDSNINMAAPRRILRNSSPAPESSHEPNVSQLKARSDFGTRQKRIQSHAPYAAPSQRSSRLRSQRDSTAKDSPPEVDKAATSRPSYMQPTFARKQKILTRERTVQQKLKHAVGQQTATSSRQPFTYY